MTYSNLKMRTSYFSQNYSVGLHTNFPRCIEKWGNGWSCRLRLWQMFREQGNITVSVAVGQSGLKQMSNFCYKILWLLLTARGDWKIIVPKILWRSDHKDISSYCILTQFVLQDLEFHKIQCFGWLKLFCL